MGSLVINIITFIETTLNTKYYMYYIPNSMQIHIIIYRLY